MSSHYSLILATDLDGTFLGGSEQQRAQFYRQINSKREDLILIFVTGRSLELITKLYTTPDFPQPDYIIGDVGTTIYDGKTLKPVTAVQEWVAQAWNGASDKIKAMLVNEPGMELQDVNPLYRVAYHYQSDKLQSSTLDKITQAGFDCILSDDKYFDVMPKGVSKGPTLLKLIATLNLNLDNVVTAGDTLNDSSLFKTGLKSIAVGNAEPKLVAEIQTMDNVYHSSDPGVAGIWDGLKKYGKDIFAAPEK